MVNLVLIVEYTKHITPYKELYIYAINKFINSIKDIPEVSLTISLYNEKAQFYCINQSPQNIKEIESSTFLPCKDSHYYDSMIQINSRLEKMYKINNQPMPLVFILCENGDMGSSTTDRLCAVQCAIESKNGWGFVFSGRSENAIKMAQKLNYQFIYKFNNNIDSMDEFVKNTHDLLSNALLSIKMKNLQI